MYKTVRQGDASLQYTILPQFDQFHLTDAASSSVLGEPVTTANRCPLEKRFRVPMARRVCLSLLIVAMFVCCAIGAYLFDEMVSRRCAIETLRTPSMKVGDIDDSKRNVDSITAPTESRPSSTSITSINVDKETSSLSSGISDYPSSIVAEKEPNAFALTMSETPTALETYSTLSSSLEAARTTSPSSLASSAAFGSPDTQAGIKNPATTDSIAGVLGRLKTLKLTRITDTVPQMYLNAGIASYKRGKITTTVLAQGLTLEGLIFKEPDGTVDSWSEKWPFDRDNADAVHPKRTLSLNLQPLALSIWITLLVLLVVVLRLVRSSIERRHDSCEEMQTENRDEAHSTLLDSPSHDFEDKE